MLTHDIPVPGLPAGGLQEEMYFPRFTTVLGSRTPWIVLNSRGLQCSRGLNSPDDFPERSASGALLCRTRILGPPEPPVPEYKHVPEHICPTALYIFRDIYTYIHTHTFIYTYTHSYTIIHIHIHLYTFIHTKDSQCSAPCTFDDSAWGQGGQGASLFFLIHTYIKPMDPPELGRMNES